MAFLVIAATAMSNLYGITTNIELLLEDMVQSIQIERVPHKVHSVYCSIDSG